MNKEQPRHTVITIQDITSQLLKMGQAIKGDNLHLGLDVVNKRLIAMNVCT